MDLELSARKKIGLKGLLNSGAEGIEIALPKSIAKKLGVERKGKCELLLFGKKRLAEAGEVHVSVKNPATNETRQASLRSVILPDAELDCVILGTEAQAALRVIPDTVTGKPIFK